MHRYIWHNHNIIWKYLIATVVFSSLLIKIGAVRYQNQNQLTSAQGILVQRTSILYSATCAVSWSSQRNLQTTMAENTATFHLQFVPNLLHYDTRKTADIPVLFAQAAMTRKNSEKDERIHSTSKPGAAIMANGPPSTLSVSLVLLLYPWTVASPELPTTARLASHFRDFSFSVGKTVRTWKKT